MKYAVTGLPSFVALNYDINNLIFTIYSENESDVANYFITINASAMHVDGILTISDAYPILLVVSNLTMQFDPIWEIAL